MDGDSAVDTIGGTATSAFTPVREAFAAVVAAQRMADDEYTAQLVVHHRGERVVDLWTGPGADGDSLLAVFSSGKGAAHLVVALLVQDGVLDLDERVAHYWPEFAAGGKAGITLRELLAHRAGVVGADAGFSLAELADELVVADRLARQRPLWRPGTAFGYHALVIGALTGEVVRRVTGRTLREIFVERVRKPYDLDVHLGLPADLEPRYLDVRPMQPTPAQQAEMLANASATDSLSRIAFDRNHPDALDLFTMPNDQALRSAGPTSFGAVASARGLAGMYAATISTVGGHPPLLTPDMVGEVGQIQSSGRDLVVGYDRAFGLGFEVSAHGYPSLGQGAFGHGGAAGSEAFADPRRGVAYAYTRRRAAFPGGPAPENADLVRAVSSAAVLLG